MTTLTVNQHHFEIDDIDRFYQKSRFLAVEDRDFNPVIYVRLDRDLCCADCANVNGARPLTKHDVRDGKGYSFDIAGYEVLDYGEVRHCDDCGEAVGTPDPADG